MTHTNRHTDPFTCVHQDAGMCDSCRSDYEEDPDAFEEYGNHTAGLARWNALLEEMELERPAAMAEAVTDVDEDSIPW